MKGKKHGLRPSMTQAEFDNGYWYATELRDFAVAIGIPLAARMRKDELERALKEFIRTGRLTGSTAGRPHTADGRDVDTGLRLDLPVVNYTSNKETKAFIQREAAKLQPGFTRASGTRYLLNRWREQQLAAGRRITYRDLVLKAIDLNKTKRGPLRMEHGRYINFLSDFRAAHKDASRAEALNAWRELKAMNTPKTYESWAKARKARTRSAR
jgi:SAP domain-containing protein